MEVPDIVRRLPQRLPEIPVHTVPGGAQLLRRHLKFLCICLEFNKSINFIYIFPRFLQKKLLQEIRIFNKPLHLIILLS